MARPKPIIVPSSPISSEQQDTNLSIDLGPLFKMFKERKRKSNLIEDFKEARGTKETLGGLQLPSEEIFPSEAPQAQQFGLEALGGLTEPQPEPQAGANIFNFLWPQ